MKSVDKQFCNIYTKLKYAEEMFNRGDFKESNDLVDGIKSQAKRLSEAINRYKLKADNGRRLRDANPEELLLLENLNKRLKIIQVKTIEKIDQTKEKFGSETDDFDVSVYFFLKDDDPDIIANDDNMICFMEHPIFHILLPDEDPDDDHNDIPAGPLSGQKHCLLMHELLCHMTPELYINDILRIGHIVVDIDIMVQLTFPP
ncbi:MAG: hypothetical protein U9N63_08920 [Pseudomonadota bacterium]|nr:hypothetical protein [Pseudomonadota bacterium]